MKALICQDHDNDDFIVIYETRNPRETCPVCVLEKEKRDLEKEVEDLKSEVNNLESQIERLKD